MCVYMYVCVCFNLLYQHFYHLFLSQVHVACMCSYMCVCIICFYSGVYCVVYLCMCVRIHVCMCFNVLYQHFYHLFLSQVHVACMCSYMCVCIICFYSGVYCVVYLCMCVCIHVCMCFNLLYQHLLFVSIIGACGTIQGTSTLHVHVWWNDGHLWGESFTTLSVPTSGPQLVYQRPWYVLFCLWKSAYLRSLAAYRKE